MKAMLAALLAGAVSVAAVPQRDPGAPRDQGAPREPGATRQQGTPRGFTRILVKKHGRWVMDGWRHFGPGDFTIDSTTGILETHGGMGLLWYTPRMYADFELQLDFKSADSSSNSGVFIRVPAEPTSDDYIYHGWEIQINDGSAGIHTTAAVYDAEAPSSFATNPPGQWNRYLITFRGDRITVVLNGKTVVDWDAVPRGKVKDFAARGYIGLQNHEGGGPVWFRDIFVRALH